MSMSNQDFAAPGLLAMRDVAHIIEADPHIPRRRKTEMLRAIATACAWFGVSPEELIAHPSNLRPRFNKLSPGALGVSAKRVSNVKSSVRATLRHAGCLAGHSYLAPLTPEWTALQALLPLGQARASLSRLMHYGSARGIRPDDLNDGIMAEFLASLENEQLLAHPRRVHKLAIDNWNGRAGTEPEWPMTKLISPNYSSAYILPEAAFRPEFIKSLNAFLRHAADDDPFNLDGRDRPLKVTSVATYRDRLLRFASLVVLAGRDIASLRSLDDLVPVDVVKLGLRYLLQRSARRPEMLASLIARLLAQVSKDVVAWPSEAERTANVEALQKISVKLAAGRGLSKKNRQRLAPLRDQSNLAQLFLLPFALAKPLRSIKVPTSTQALLMQWALALMILTFCPLRIGTLCVLRLDKHLVWSRSNMRGDLTLEFETGELKNDDPASLPLPKECADLAHFRPALIDGPSQYLFASRSGLHSRNRSLLSRQLFRLIHRRIGLEVNPHLYRHIVHLVILQRLPGAYAMVSRVLTHRALQTAVDNYSSYDAELSMRAFQQLVREVQDGSALGKAATPTAIAFSLADEHHRHGKR